MNVQTTAQRPRFQDTNTDRAVLLQIVLRKPAPPQVYLYRIIRNSVVGQGERPEIAPATIPEKMRDA